MCCWKRFGNDEWLSVIVSVASLLLLGYFYFYQNETSRISFHDYGATLLIISFLATFVLVVGYSIKLFEKEKIIDAFSIIDFGLLSQWVVYYDYHPKSCLFYAASFTLLVIPIVEKLGACKNWAATWEFLPGKVLLYFFALLATTIMANNGDKKTIVEALLTPKTGFYPALAGAFVFSIFIGVIVYLTFYQGQVNSNRKK